jgi:hypothetical protein
MLLFFERGAIWAPPNQPKNVQNGPKMGRMYGPMFKLKNKPLTESLGPIFKKKWSETNGNLVFFMLLFCVGGPFEYTQINQKKTTKVP